MLRIVAILMFSVLLTACSSTKSVDVPATPTEKENKEAIRTLAWQNLRDTASTSATDVLIKDAYGAEQRGETETALALYISASQQGSAQAHYELARLYAKGVNGHQDFAKSNEHLTMAFGMGHVEATRVLAWQYLRGAGVPKDVEKAKQLFGKAAVSSVRAQRELGMLYVNAYTPYPLNDEQKGLEYLRKATAANDAEAAYYLYRTLTKAGVPSKESDDAILVAVKQEYPKALYHFGKTAMNQGRYQQAAQIFMKASMHGDTESMFEYANNVMLKRFKSDDRELEAYTWFAIAAERKHPQAIDEMVALKGVKTNFETKQPGRLNDMIAQTKGMIQPWQAPQDK